MVCSFKWFSTVTEHFILFLTQFTNYSLKIKQNNNNNKNRYAHQKALKVRMTSEINWCWSRIHTHHRLAIIWLWALLSDACDANHAIQYFVVRGSLFVVFWFFLSLFAHIFNHVLRLMRWIAFQYTHRMWCITFSQR